MQRPTDSISEAKYKKSLKKYIVSKILALQTILCMS